MSASSSPVSETVQTVARLFGLLSSDSLDVRPGPIAKRHLLSIELALELFVRLHEEDST